MEVTTKYIAAGCNCTYNCHVLDGDFVYFASNNSLAAYDLQAQKVLCTEVAHKKRINCVRLVKSRESTQKRVITVGTDGLLCIWNVEYSKDYQSVKLDPILSKSVYNDDVSITVCDAVQLTTPSVTYLVLIDTNSRVSLLQWDEDKNTIEVLQSIPINRSVALDVSFHIIDDRNLIIGLALDSGSVSLFEFETKNNVVKEACVLTKHEDWVRCLHFMTLETGEILLASGGQDSYIAVWRFTKEKLTSDFEFQIHQFGDYAVVFDSMIIGHEGWISSLQWNSKGQLLSCCSDQSTIIWENVGEMWIEKSRFGVIGGLLLGGFGANFSDNFVTVAGFQGAIQIWRKNVEDWNLDPSISGHFSIVSDLDYHPSGYYLLTTSEDQTTRIHAPVDKKGIWHEISRPQIHGHDIFAGKFVQNKIISGAEEKILRAFQPTNVFVHNLKDISSIEYKDDDVASAASLPALGLSNQTEDTDETLNPSEIPVTTRLDEDYLRSQTLWPEISKLYGHVYEICSIGTCHVNNLVASASQASKPQFSSIIVWCAYEWKSLGEFPHHKLNVTGLEFSKDGKFLLSVSRDRTWALWDVCVLMDKDLAKKEKKPRVSISVLEVGTTHTRAVWVGTWDPNCNFFVTGGRDKKLMVWRPKSDEVKKNFHCDTILALDSPVSSAAVKQDGKTIVIGLEDGRILIYQYNTAESDEKSKMVSLKQLDQSMAHHDVVKRIVFHPKRSSEFASGSADHSVKVFNIMECQMNNVTP